jgi:hypothetical protein
MTPKLATGGTAGSVRRNKNNRYFRMRQRVACEDGFWKIVLVSAYAGPRKGRLEAICRDTGKIRLESA